MACLCQELCRPVTDGKHAASVHACGCRHLALKQERSNHAARVYLSLAKTLPAADRLQQTVGADTESGNVNA